MLAFRWVATSLSDSRMNLALEESMLAGQSGLTVRVWGNERSVIIGSGQLARFETDLEACRDLRIPVVRRFTGGGAVYHGRGNLNWSIFISAGFRSGTVRFVWDAGVIFPMAARLVVEALRRAGVRSWFDRPNRILTGEGKVSGMAAYLARRGLLCHGTLLLHADLEEASRLTRPRGDAERRYVRSKEMRMANTEVPGSSFEEALRDVIAESAGEASPEGCSDGEMELARRLVAEKYGRDEWNLGDPFSGRWTAG